MGNSNTNTEKLSSKFSFILREWLTDDELEQINQTNQEEDQEGDSNICATHDFCDSNMAMDEAFKNVMGREFDLESESDVALFNAAWDMSKKNKFKVA